MEYPKLESGSQPEVAATSRCVPRGASLGLAAASRSPLAPSRPLVEGTQPRGRHSACPDARREPGVPTPYSVSEIGFVNLRVGTRSRRTSLPHQQPAGPSLRNKGFSDSLLNTESPVECDATRSKQRIGTESTRHCCRTPDDGNLRGALPLRVPRPRFVRVGPFASNFLIVTVSRLKRDVTYSKQRAGVPLVPRGPSWPRRERP